MIAGATLVPGEGEGRLLALDAPVSFWGGVDPRAGVIVDVEHPQRGAALAGRVLVMSAGRGSSSGSSVLAECLRQGLGPAAIVIARRDGILVTGALVAVELYGVSCPVALIEDETDFARLRAMPAARILAGSDGLARIDVAGS
jgi:predicted aconitase with swiveling domain